MNNTKEIKFHNTLPINTTLRGHNCEYLIEEVLGQGTFGITYLATVYLQGNLGRLPLKFHVTIKEFFMKEINGREESTVTSDSQGGMFDKYKRKFAQEARSLKSLNHPHIVKVMDFFEANNTYYYVMDYLCGGSIEDLIARESFLAEDTAISYAKQIGEALGYMHENKILHLDMKPNNVMLNADGEAIVIDFGLSKQYDENGEPESSTTVGGGTVGYAPLEQSTHHDGHGFPVTMDVYALGATLYKMLVGVRAPEASSILNDGFPTQNLHQRNVSLEATKAIEKSMAPMKKDRFQSISEFINHLPKIKSNINVVDIDVESESTTIENNVVKSKKRANKEKQILSLAEVINAADNAFGRNDYPTALKYYIEAFRRDDSIGEIAYTIGEIYYRGHDIQEKKQKGGGRYASMNDYYHRCQKASPWFQKAYDLGIDTSNELLQKAQEFYDVKDYKHYHKALHECVDKNYKCEKAINLLIESYEKGIGCKADTVEANYIRKRQLSKVPEFVDQCNVSLEQNQKQENVIKETATITPKEKSVISLKDKLGCAFWSIVICFIVWVNIPQEWIETPWNFVCAYCGSSKHQLNIGERYSIHGNQQKTYEWYEKAANNGNDIAMFRIAYMYYTGEEGKEKDFSKALDWFLKAAQNGHCYAMEHIGNMYENGEGVELSQQKAIEWYKKAYQHGSCGKEIHEHLTNLGVPEDSLSSWWAYYTRNNRK